MSKRGYKVNEIFRSPQGEGIRTGHMSVFVRFAGCNLRCAQEIGPRSPGGFDCDTEFMSGQRVTLEQVVHEVANAAGAMTGWVVLTGGEPMLQVDEDLVDALHDRGFLLQIETNGTREVTPGIDFITVSPKVAEHCIRQRQAHEVKYVRHHTQGVPRTVVDADHYWLSPAFLGDMPDPRAMEHCQRLAAQNPPWKVSVQAHKLWGVR